MEGIDPKKKGKKRKKRDKRRKYKKGRGATNLKTMSAKEESKSTGKRAYTKADKKTANMWAGSAQGKQSFGGGSGGSNLTVNVYTSGGKGGGGGGKGGGKAPRERPTKAELNREKARATAETTARTAETSRTQAEYRLNETRRQERQPPVYLQLGNTANVSPDIAVQRGLIEDERRWHTEKAIETERRVIEITEETQKRMEKRSKRDIRAVRGMRDDIRASQEREPPRRPPPRKTKSRSKSKSKSPEETDREQRELEKRALFGTPDKDEVLEGGYSPSPEKSGGVDNFDPLFSPPSLKRELAEATRLIERRLKLLKEQEILHRKIEESDALSEIEKEEDMSEFEREEPKNIVMEEITEDRPRMGLSTEVDLELEEAENIKKAKELSLKAEGLRKSPKKKPLGE